MKRFALLIATLAYLLLPATAYAFNPLANACAGAKSASACGASSNNPIAGPNGVLEKVTVVLATVAGVVAVIIIIVAGFILVTAGGNPKRVEEARNAIIGALVGIIIILAAAGIITFVVNKV